MIEQKQQATSKPVEDMLTAEFTRKVSPAREEPVDMDGQNSDVDMVGEDEEQRASESHVSESYSNENHVTKEEQRPVVFFNFL